MNIITLVSLRKHASIWQVQVYYSTDTGVLLLSYKGKSISV